MFQSIFGSRKGNPLTPSANSRGLGTLGIGTELLPLSMMLLGRENAGKSALLTAMDLVWMNHNLRSGLQMNLMGPDGAELSPLVLASRMDKIQRRLWALSENGDGLKSTLAPEPVNYCICEGATPRLQLNTSDEVGQIISNSNSESSPEELRQYDAFLKRLAARDLITIVFSPPSRDPHALADFQWAKDLKLYSAYLTEGLRKGDRRKPVSVAILINKVDTLFDDEASAREGLPDQLLRGALEALVQVIEHEPRIVNAAIFPVSALGFGNAVVREESGGTLAEDAEAIRPWHLTTRGGLEREYGIGQGRTIEPFNLQALILWSLLAAALPKEIDLVADRSGDPPLVRVCRLLREDLDQQAGWLVPLKGHGC